MDPRAPRRCATTLPGRVADARAGQRSSVRAFGGIEPPALALYPLDGRCGQEPDLDPIPRYVLWPHPSPRALFDVGDREDDELCAEDRRPRATAARPAMACRARLGRTAARRRPGRRLRAVRHGLVPDHLLPRAV